MQVDGDGDGDHFVYVFQLLFESDAAQFALVVSLFIRTIACENISDVSITLLLHEASPREIVSPTLLVVRESLTLAAGLAHLAGRCGESGACCCVYCYCQRLLRYCWFVFAGIMPRKLQISSILSESK